MPTPSSDNSESPGCPSIERLAALLDSHEGDDGGELASHLETCESCRQRLDALAGKGAWLDPLSGKSDPVSTNVIVDADAEPELRQALDAAHNCGQSAVEHGPVASPPPELSFLSPSATPGYIGRLGPYNVIELVGQGGMGIVLKAHDPSLDRIVAIKVLSPAWAAHPEARRRFVREARAAAAVSHEHVVTIHAVDEANNLPYLVMQFVGGRSLDARIRATGPLKLEEVLRIGMQTASGLAAAHAQGLVHRDIKPGNIMLENGVERVKITDFGLARAADDAAITVTGQVTGTPMYMAPEQARGERVDHRADLFSLGAVLYAMCTARPPFAAANPLTSLRKVCEEEPQSVDSVNQAMPSWLGEVVRRLMEKDPAKRPQSAAAVADELARHLARIQNSGSKSSDDGHAAVSPIRPAKPRRRGLLAGVSCVAVVLAGSLLFTESRGITRLRARLWSGTAPTVGDSSAGPKEAETLASSRQPPAVVSTGPFSVVSANPKQSRSFATLSEAIAAAAPGDGVEIRQDGRITTPRIDVGTRPLFLRAGEGFAPVLAQAAENQAILTTRGPLVLEGIAFEGSASDSREAAPHGSEPGECLLFAGGGPLYVSNCRFVAKAPIDARFGCVRLADVASCEIRNSELHALRSTGVQWLMTPGHGGTLRLQNCAGATRYQVVARNEGESPATLDVDGCSFNAMWFLGFLPASRQERLTVDLSRSAFVSRALCMDVGLAAARTPGATKINFKDRRCIFDIGRPGAGDLATHAQTNDETAAPPQPATTQPRLTRNDSIEAEIRFRGDFRAKMMRGELPEVADFAIQIVHGPGGRRFPPRAYSTIGAQTESVGIGPAYDNVKKSAAYVQWQQQVEAVVRQSR
jgi:serine/threonine-protein kinase